jgi:hypothetical protein
VQNRAKHVNLWLLIGGKGELSAPVIDEYLSTLTPLVPEVIELLPYLCNYPSDEFCATMARFYDLRN